MSGSQKGTLLSLFDDEEYLGPLVETTSRADAPKRPAKKAKSPQMSTAAAGTASALPEQGFLPGLSRRGRPRLAKPISPVERTAEHRRKRIEAGAKRVEIILDKDISQALDALAEHFKEPRSDVISTLIAKAATKVLKK
jgi:hypothetical protein